MNDQEKKIQDLLAEETKNIQVPDNLQPENIEKLLEQKAFEEKKKSRTKRTAVFGVVAAACVLVVGITAVSRKLGNMGDIEPLIVADATEDLEVGNAMETPKQYEDIFDYIKESGHAQNGVVYDAETTFSNAKSLETSDARAAETGSADYSQTNVRTAGVQEGDIVKTDGKYLYVLNDNASEIAVVDVQNDQMKEVSMIKVPDGMQVGEMYIMDEKLYVLGTKTIEEACEENDYLSREGTSVLTFNIKDRENPDLEAEVTQDGYYMSSRISDGILYTFSEFYVPSVERKDDIELYVPQVAGEFVKTDDIYLPSIRTANSYLIATSVKLSEPDRVIDQKAVLSDNGQLYVSENNIYIYESTWRSSWARSENESSSKTIIRKISYHNGKMEGVSQAKVEGYLNDSFSIDEYDGYLRLVVTLEKGSEDTNSVYVLDEDLEMVGSIENLAKEERIYSARLMGKIGYFVTYKNTDPLFSVDFSDPRHPRIIGALKIPGFSEYLHPYSENLLLGIGMDTDENSGVTSGVKISMFDISDPADVKEINKYVIEDAYYSEVFNEYKAVLVDPQKDIIGFTTEGNETIYHVFGYDQERGFISKMEEQVNGTGWMGTRGLYVGERLFVVKGNIIESYQIGDYQKIDDLAI